MRWKLFGELFKNKELRSFFNEKEDGKKEMIKREIVTFRKGFGEGDLENLKMVLLFVIMKKVWAHYLTCLLYTSDAADEEDSVDLGGRRIIKK